MKFALFRWKNKNHAPKIFQMEKLGSLAVFDDFDSKTMFDYLRSIKCIQMIQMRQILKIVQTQPWSVVLWARLVTIGIPLGDSSVKWGILDAVYRGPNFRSLVCGRWLCAVELVIQHPWRKRTNSHWNLRMMVFRSWMIMVYHGHAWPCIWATTRPNQAANRSSWL